MPRVDSVSTRGGDQVNLEAHVLYPLDDAFNAQVRFSSKLQGDLEQDFRDSSRYHIYFKPNVGEAYGFKLTGTLVVYDENEQHTVCAYCCVRVVPSDPIM